MTYCVWASCTCERFGICIGGAVGADIEIRVWFVLLANWLEEEVHYFILSSILSSFFFLNFVFFSPSFLASFLHLVGQVGVFVEQLAEVEHDGLPVEAGVGKDQLECLTSWTRLRCLRQLTVHTDCIWQMIHDNLSRSCSTGVIFSPPFWLVCSPLPPRNRSRSHLVSESGKC